MRLHLLCKLVLLIGVIVLSADNDLVSWITSIIRTRAQAMLLISSPGFELAFEVVLLIRDNCFQDINPGIHGSPGRQFVASFTCTGATTKAVGVTGVFVGALRAGSGWYR